MAILRYLLIFILLYWLYKRVKRIFFPDVRRQNSYGGGGYNGYSRNQQQNREGNIRISKRPPRNPEEKHVSGGEYVDFEEVD